MSEQQRPTFCDVVDRSHVVICCGSGGVGKTTTAAMIAMESARSGRRAVVVTIDPARRLADALGIDGLTNEPARIDGPWDDSGGAMSAMMLDTKATFDNLVRRYSTDPDQAERILDNTFYRNISGSLSGTQEYMASEKLYELAVEGDFDLVVVDTPPTRNALDFIDAPQRLAKFLDHRLYRVLTSPTRGLVRVANVAAQTLTRSLAKAVGAEVVGDAIAFFSAFEGMEGGFKERAAEVASLLGRDDTAFVLVASPKADTVAEAAFFAEELARSDIEVRALIVNRMQPRFDAASRGGDRTGPSRSASEDGDLRAIADSFADTAIGDLYTCLADARQLADGEEENLSGLAALVDPAPIVRIPIQPFEISDLDSLHQLGSLLFADCGGSDDAG